MEVWGTSVIHLPARRRDVLQLVDGGETAVPLAEQPDGRDLAAWESGALNAAVPLAEVSVPVGEGPPMHLHPGVVEAFHLLAGELEMCGPGQAYRVRPGDAVVVPAGVPHAYRSAGEESARLLFVLLPG